MGDRGQIKFVYGSGESINFYTHWTGTELPETLAAALERGEQRWTDESYLARIIFSEMIKDYVDDILGFGISPYDMGPDHDEITVRVEEGTVTIANRTWKFAEYVVAFKTSGRPA